MRQRRWIGLILPAVLMMRTEAARFDVKTLEQLGYNADIVEFFKTARFLPGVHQVSLDVNASQRYQDDVRFDQEGELCLDPRLAETLRLRVTTSLGECDRFVTHWPQAQVRVFPGTFRVEITLPETAFDPVKLRSELQGGHALLMNYNLYGYRQRSAVGSQQTLQAMLEPRINISNWVIRNRSLYSHNESDKRLEVYETSASRDFPQWGGIVQVGEFGAGGSLSGGLPITGGQWASDGQRQAKASLAVPLQGSVNSQATLEVAQRDKVVYRTLLPAGPFSLDSLGQAIAGVETSVTVTDAEGHRQHFIVTPGLGDESRGQSGYQVALGRYRTYGGRQDTSAPPALLMGERTFSLADQRQMGVGGTVAEKYQRLAWQGSVGDEVGNWLSMGVVYSRGRQSGGELSAQGQKMLESNLLLSLSSRYHSRGFTDADEALNAPADGSESTSRLRYASSAGLSWMTPKWGAFTYNLSHERYYGDSRDSWLHTLTYGKKLRNTTLNLSVQSSAYERMTLYAGVSVPLGGGNLSSRLQLRQGNQMTLGSSWQGPLSERTQGYLDVSRDRNGEYQGGGNLSGQTPYTLLTVGATRAGQGSSSLSLGASGTLGMANGTWVTSPQAAGDTMVVVRVPGQSGVAVTGSSSGITDFAGDALLPSVTPYMPLKAQIDTLSLPLNLRLDSTGTELELARGTVAERQFRVTEVRQLLLTLRDEAGVLLQTGSSVHDAQGKMLATLMGEGNLLLVNDDIGKPLRVRRVNKNECVVSYEVPATFDPSVLYEEREAVCRPAAPSNGMDK
ncbi:membrane protein [Serratia marcescens]|nr:membrane protein [Serratia marcescens]